MANNYVIDFSDPLSGSFTITDAGFNGPGGKQADTTLRLYGRAAPQWGESVDENFAKLLENFMSATEPFYPKPGQFWVKTYLYYHDVVADQFYAFSPSASTWSLIDVPASSTAPSQPQSGQYWFDTTNSVLSQFFQPYKQQTAAWQPRWYQEGTGNPNGVSSAYHELMMFDATTKTWAAVPVATNTSSTAAPSNNRGGTLRFDSVTGNMYYWNTVTQSWQLFSAGGVNPIIVGDLNMGGFKIVNLSAPAAAGDALNLGAGDGRYVIKSGDTMTGQLTLGAGNPTTALHAANKAYVDTQSAAAAAAAIASLVSIPSGLICMWSGATNAIPTGWLLCDGTAGTPNLKDRFVVGAGLSYTVGATGGSKDAAVPSHSHGFSTFTDAGGSHTHNLNDPGHSHTYNSVAYTGVHQIDGRDVASLYYQLAVPTVTAGSVTGISIAAVGAHQHSMSGSTSASGVSATNMNLPPYYALAYIMKA